MMRLHGMDVSAALLLMFAAYYIPDNKQDL
jgi:hypothetical protein